MVSVVEGVLRMVESKETMRLDGAGERLMFGRVADFHSTGSRPMKRSMKNEEEMQSI